MNRDERLETRFLMGPSAASVVLRWCVHISQRSLQLHKTSRCWGINASVVLVACFCSLMVNTGITCFAEGPLRIAVFLRDTWHSSAH